MPYRVPLILFVITLLMASSDPVKQVLMKANDHIRMRKYASACDVLFNFDQDNDTIEILDLKITMALRYSVHNILYKSFVFVDFDKNQHVEDYEICPECFHQSRIVDFRIEELLLNKIGEYPRQGAYYRFLGDYYFHVYNMRKDKGAAVDSTLPAKIKRNYEKAESLKAAGSITYDNHAIVLLVEKKYKEAIALLRTGLMIDEQCCNSNYNMAYALFMTGEHKEALFYVKKAIDCYKNPLNQSDAYLLAGQLYELQRDYDNSLMNYQMARAKGRKDYFCAKKILALTLKLKIPEESLQEAAKLLMLDVNNLEYYLDAMDLFVSNGKSDLFEDFLQRLGKIFNKDHHVLGNIYVAKAGMCFRLTGDFERKRKNLEKARKEFSRVFPENHEIFDMIDKQMGR